MNNEFEKYEGYLKEMITEFSRFVFIVRGTEIQEKVVEEISGLLNQIKEEKESQCQKNNELIANTLLSYEILLKSVSSEIQMAMNIKNDCAPIAWNKLVDAQGGIEAVLRIGILDTNLLRVYQNRLLLMEKILFPPQIFMSVGFITKESHCSLCRDSYEKCIHIKGRAYMGEMCMEVLTECTKLEEVSIVDNPADKRCRATSYNENGITVDAMTLREISENKD